jgi:hypothetical protein
MLWTKALHLIFMVTWFAGLLHRSPGHRPTLAGSGTLAAKSIRGRFHSLCECAAIPGRVNRPALHNPREVRV